MNGIAYEYEPDYQHDLPENTRTAYTPDFKLTESGVYIEHFGVRKSNSKDGGTIFTTAPHVDRRTYLEGMEWKRKVHAEHETTLIETFSYERVEGHLIESLEQKFAPHVQPNPMPSEDVFEQLTEMGQVDAVPSEIVDDPLLDLVLSKPEKYDHAEEIHKRTGH